MKQAMTKKGKRKSFELDALVNDGNDVDFLPLDGGPHKISKGDNLENKATVLYIGRIPHGFYEDEMEGFFKQFGTIKRLKIARNRKTGKSKHYGYVEFEYPEVAKIVADCMHNYLLFEHMLQVYLVPPEHVHPKLWRGVNRRYKPPVDFVQIERKKHNKDRTLEEHQKLLKTILKKDKKRRKKLEAAGIEYECPVIEGANQPVPKKIRFD
uniref:RRM domain-containing protein n=1 Tax=Opuntia streptacantha TaxID=393608 RepID=A0A7C9DBS2_OPUST